MKSTLVLGLALGLTGYAMAQDTSDTSTETQSFVPADFEQFAPRTALDMVERIPGFRISGNNDGERGFGQASQNVLINGQRISSKSTSARDALNRISASNVIRIDVLEGATLDIAGLSGQVVNVISKTTGVSGTWTYRHRYRENLPPVYDWIELSANGENGNLSWTLGLESEPGRGASAGLERITDGTGELTELRDEDFTFIGTFVKTSGSLAWTPANGHIANLNAEYTIIESNEREASIRFSPDREEIARTIFQFAEDEWNSEVGGDYEFDLGPGRLKFIGLQRNEHSPTISRFYGGRIDGSDFSEEVFERTVDESESILRTEYTLNTSETTDWQVSLEGAFNSLESDAKLFEATGTGPLVPVDIGDPDITVEERRAEAFITHGRQLTPKIRLQASLGGEVSELMSDGENGQTRTFTRPKGSISTTWTPRDNLTINTTLEREVGQLNFFDFVSSVDLNQGDDQTGNVDIVPEQSWSLEVEAERDYGDWGAATFSVRGEALEDIVDQVPIGTGEGPGNLDSATRIRFEVEGTFKFDKLGWKGARIEYEGDWRKSWVDDPLTGDTRRINDDLIYVYELEFRHDIPGTDWAWGLNYEEYQEAPTFRINSQRRFENQPGFMWGFIEHKDVFGMTASVFLANLTDQDDQFTRVIYSPDRLGPIDRVEDRTRNFGHILTLRLRGNF
ncbi:MAG: TonB-dependent receptor plug domain-containing protein [Henriciella sp.]|nr:TonB-dependent receptor plug domain-containing protein [Henriciella sp.]